MADYPAAGTEPQKKDGEQTVAAEYVAPPNPVEETTLFSKCREYYRGAFEYQRRRHGEWLENYLLTRSRVITNRITQRQSVVIPLAKETVKTILANIDDEIDIAFEDRGNDEQKEIYCNAAWEEFVRRENMQIKDMMDKRAQLTYGRGVMMLNIVNSQIVAQVLDPADLLVDRFCDPSDIETATYVCRRNIFRKFDQLWQNSLYDKQKLQEVYKFMQTSQGLIRIAENFGRVADQAEKLRTLGDTQAISPQLGDAWVELREHYVKITEESIVKKYGCEKDGYVRFVVVECEGQAISCSPLKERLRVNHLMIETWADDVEITDFWSDGAVDVVRSPNKVVNAWYSQLVENRTMRNFGMHYYDSTASESFRPDTFTPKPWGWVPVPGNPDQIIKKVDFPDLSESIDELQFVINSAEKATAATATEKGVQGEGKVTLGEIQLTTAKAMQRITAIAKYYRLSRKRLAEKWIELYTANADRMPKLTLHKKGSSGKWYEVTISPSEFKSEKGYVVSVTSGAEQEQKNMEAIQRLTAVAGSMPDNAPMQRIKKRKMLDLVDLSPDEKKEVTDADEKAMELAGQTLSNVGEQMPPIPGMPTMQPQQMPNMPIPA